MKIIHHKELLRTIKRTKVKFASLILIVSLGFSTFLGISFAKSSMMERGNGYYNDQYFHNIEVTYAYGLADDDVQAIDKLEGVDTAEGGYSTTGFMKLSDRDRLVTVQSITQKLDKATLLKGRLPEKADEIAVERSLNEEENISIGDILNIDCSDTKGVNYLTQTRFTVVGIVEHPAYTSNYEYSRRGTSTKGNGNCMNYLMVSGEAFDKKALNNSYTNIYIWSNTLRDYDTFSKEYEKRCNDLATDVKRLGLERADKKYEEIVKNNELLKIEEQPVKAGWLVLTRDANASYVMYRANTDALGKLSISFALVYIVVAAMVCYSSIGRMIYEQKILIGTQKALGYRKREILWKYLRYATLCTLLGSVGGIASAVYLVEDLSLSSYVPMYIFQDYARVFVPEQIILVLLGGLVLMWAATFIACSKLLKMPATQLLTYSEQENNNERFFEGFKGWKRLSLYTRAMIRNLLNDKKHFLTTIIGVAGCTALMVIGFTLKFSIEAVNVEQFEKIHKYELCLITSGKSEDEIAKFKEYLDQKPDIDYVNLTDKMVNVRAGRQKYLSASILTTDSPDLSRYFSLVDANTGKDIAVPAQGALINSHLAKYYGVEKGDYIEIMDEMGNGIPVQVAGLIKNYVNHYLVMDPAYYKQIMGKEPLKNIFYMNLNGEKKEEIQSDLERIDGFAALSGKEIGIEIFEDISNSINSVIQTLIFLSAVMAVVVVMNLASMYIREKERVLAIMRVNGFTLRETKAYIARNDTTIMIIGLLIGCLGGIILGRFIVVAIENNSSCFVHSPSLKACLISCALSGGFSVIVNMLARRRIHHLPLNNVNATD